MKQFYRVFTNIWVNYEILF